MSSRLSAVLPTCLCSRLAASRAQLPPFQSKPNCFLIRPRYNSTGYRAENQRNDLDEALDSSFAQVAPSYTSRTATQPILQQSASDALLFTANPIVHNEEVEQTRISAILSASEHAHDHDNIQAGSSAPVVDEFRNKSWIIAWETLHEELLEIRQDRNRSVRDQWSTYHAFARSLVGDLKSDDFSQRWQKMTIKDKAQVLPLLLAGSLAESAAQTLVVLSNLEVLPKNFRTRMQCLRHIHLAFPYELSSGSRARQAFQREIDKLRSPEKWGKSMSIPHLDTLLTWSTHGQCERIMDTFFEYYPNAQREALLPLITCCIKLGKLDRALEMFKELPENLLQNPTEPVLEARNRLLKRDTVTKTEFGSNFVMLPQILALGVQPDASLHNAVLEAAVRNGVPEVAWDLYSYLQASQLPVNARAHLVLLKDAFQRRNVEAVNEIMTAIHSDAELVKDPYLIAYSMNIVRNICYYERKTSSSEALSHIMALYDRAYSRAPLYKVHILQEPIDGGPADVLPNPRPDSLAFTIWSYTLVQYSVKTVDHLWLRIQQLLAQGDKDLAAAARLDIIFNGFMLFYARTPSTMVKSLQVMHYMLEHSHHLRWGTTPRSWSILLGGFLRHDQIAQAQMVVKMMLRMGYQIETLLEDYMPNDYSLADLGAHAVATLDERSMPANLEEHLALASGSSPFPEMKMNNVVPREPVLHGPRVWNGFIDLRPVESSHKRLFATDLLGGASVEER